MRGEDRNGSDVKTRALGELGLRRFGPHERRFGEDKEAADLPNRANARENSARDRERGRTVGLAARTPRVRDRHPRPRNWNQKALVSRRLFPAVGLRHGRGVPANEQRATGQRQTPARSRGRVLRGRWGRWNQRTSIGRTRWRQLRARRAPREQRHGDDQQRPEASHRGLFARVRAERKHNARRSPGRLTKTSQFVRRARLKMPA